jgi:two-component system alkaline phosphatase synthesis response regulator PhoP
MLEKFFNKKVLNKRVLVVEDDAMLSTVLAESLKVEKFKVSVVADGSEGLKMALEHHPDLILLDLVMPVMDGLTMLHKLREDKWGKQAQVIVLSNISDTDKVKEAIDNGSDEYLIKADWNVIEVANKVKKILDLK